MEINIKEEINMPFGNRTGPRGYGPRSGRGLGYCTGYDSPGYTKGRSMGQGFGRWLRMGRGMGREPGMGQGFGRGMGRRFAYEDNDPYYFREPPYYGPAVPYAEPTKEEETSYLKRLIESLENELKAVKERLKEVTKKE